VFVRRRSVFVRTVFSEELLILTVTGFSDLHSVLTKSTHPTWWEGLVAPSLPKNATSSGLDHSGPSPHFYVDLCPRGRVDGCFGQHDSAKCLQRMELFFCHSVIYSLSV